MTTDSYITITVSVDICLISSISVICLTELSKKSNTSNSIHNNQTIVWNNRVYSPITQIHFDKKTSDEHFDS